MSSFNDCIKFSLNIKDKNIIFLDFFNNFINEKAHKIYPARPSTQINKYWNLALLKYRQINDQTLTPFKHNYSGVLNGFEYFSRRSLIARLNKLNVLLMIIVISKIYQSELGWNKIE